MIPARAARRSAVSLTALLFALTAQPALAVPLLQEGGGGNNRMEVIAWTLAAIAATLILLAIGYFYRRAAGIDKPPPVTILEPGQRITGD